jgi:hypothetical protein
MDSQACIMTAGLFVFASIVLFLFPLAERFAVAAALIAVFLALVAIMQAIREGHKPKQ